MEHIITTYGGGELFTLVFQGIAALFKTDGTGVIMSLIRVGLTVGSVYVVILMLFKSQVIEGFKWFLWVVAATNLLFLPKTTIWIHDPLCNTKTKIDNVPLSLGIFASTVSQVGRSITEKFESSFSLPDDMKYHKAGTVFASKLMSQIGQFRIVDAGFKGNMERFVNQCVVYDAMIGQQYTLDDLQHTANIWGLVTAKASPILGFLYKEGQSPGTILTCREGAAKLGLLWAEQIAKATTIYGSRVNNRTLTQSAFNTNLISSVHLLSSSINFAQSATDLLKQEMMINAIEEASNNKLSELGSASNYTATKALLQQRSAYAAAGEIAARTLPLFKNVIEALSYALFIFIVVLALLPNGYRTLLTYCGILAWTQLWAPLYAVLNLVMTLYGKHETMGHGLKDGLTLINSSAIINANADMVTLAAWLSVSIPFISYGILKQGAAAFVGLAQHLGSAMQSAASSAAAETVSGNISLGNVSMGTQAYQNTSAFQHNTSPSYTASQFKALSPAGIEQSTFGDGSQSLSTQTLSRLSVQIMGTENTSYSQQQSLSEAKSVVESKSIAAGQAMDAATQDTTNFLSQVGNAISSGTDFNQSVSASEVKTLQDFKNHVKDIQQNTGMTETQAMEAAVGASSGALQLLGIDIKGGFSSAAARQKAIQAADSVAKQTNYSDNLDKVISAAQSFAESNHDTKNAELGKGVTSSLNKAKSLRDEVSVAQNTVDTLSNDISANQGKSLSINKDLTQSVLEFIAHQPINPGPNGESKGQIGYEGARRIIENGGPERDTYLQRFQEKNPQYKIQGINSAKEDANLSAKFSEESAQVAPNAGVMAQHAQNTENVLSQAKQTGLYPGKTPESRQPEITDSLNNQDGIINQKKHVIDKHEKALQDAEKDSKSQTLVGAMASNALESLTPNMDAAFQHLAKTEAAYQQFVEQQEQEKAQRLAGSSSAPSSEAAQEQSQPPSAFAAFKERLDQDVQEIQPLQPLQDSSLWANTLHKPEVVAPSHEQQILEGERKVTNEIRPHSTFKEDLEKGEKEHSIMQSSQKSSPKATVHETASISSFDKIPSLTGRISNLKKGENDQASTMKESSSDTLFAHAATSPTIAPSTNNPSIKTEKSPIQQIQPLQQLPEKPEQTKEPPLPSPKLLLSPSNIRK